MDEIKDKYMMREDLLKCLAKMSDINKTLDALEEYIIEREWLAKLEVVQHYQRLLNCDANDIITRNDFLKSSTMVAELAKNGKLSTSEQFKKSAILGRWNENM